MNCGCLKGKRKGEDIGIGSSELPLCILKGFLKGLSGLVGDHLFYPKGTSDSNKSLSKTVEALGYPHRTRTLKVWIGKLAK